MKISQADKQLCQLIYRGSVIFHVEHLKINIFHVFHNSVFMKYLIIIFKRLWQHFIKKKNKVVIPVKIQIGRLLSNFLQLYPSCQMVQNSVGCHVAYLNLPRSDQAQISRLKPVQDISPTGVLCEPQSDLTDLKTFFWQEL